MELMETYVMLPNIVRHCVQVMRVSRVIADNLRQGVTVNKELIIAAALLHDITKTRSLETRERHDTSGGKLLRELGFARIAGIVEQHVILEQFDPHGAIEEREIVFYADKRVKHDTIVTVPERMQDLIRRYGKTEEVRTRILQGQNRALAVEEKLAGFMAVDIHRAIGEIPSPGTSCNRG